MIARAAALEADTLQPERLVVVGEYGTDRSAWEHGLVVLACGVAYWRESEQGRHRLLVEAERAPAVEEQLRRFDDESRRWPPVRVEDPAARRRLEWSTPLLWAAGLAVIHVLQARGGSWVEAGALQARGILERGEGWRLFTALFLHADIAHLVANAVTGSAVFAVVLAALGRIRGWTLILAAALLGNLAAVLLRAGQAYQSIGASTAVFGGLGLLTGRAIRRGKALAPKGALPPLAAGLAALALFGAGEPRVDALAHLTGFAAGVLVGAVAAADARVDGEGPKGRRSRDQSR